MKTLLYISIQVLVICYYQNLQAQHKEHLEGQVFEIKDKDKKIPLAGVSIYWRGTQEGTLTQEDGKFRLHPNESSKHLIFSLLGYESDTALVEHFDTFLKIELHLSSLAEIVVDDKKIEAETIQSELLTRKDLEKAACCNLSESFETNASVDVSSTDAVTGTRRIRMLGLDGVYTQIMRENLPNVRGLSARTGLQYIPGTWITSIDINKGAGSVANGYESTTGQINVELVKPELSKEKLFLNLYANGAGRFEANLNTAFKLSKKWHTGFLLHASDLSFVNDRNKDGFRDVPEFTMLSLLNRWKYSGDYTKAQFGMVALYDDRLGGQISFDKNTNRNSSNPYGYASLTRRFEVFGKIGFISKKKAGQSLGLLVSAVHHDQESFWGMTDYKASQNNLSLNFIFQTEINSKHRFRLGGNYLLDDYTENYTSEKQTLNQSRTEHVSGIFTEYTFEPNTAFAAILGLRTDFHNLYGTFFTPRLHLKYNLGDKTTLRLSGGRGQRVANPIIENLSYFISARQLFLAENLQPEVAWNYGGSLSQQIDIGERKAILVVDFYRTSFENQIVTDLDASANQIRFYNLDGSSFANSFQASLEYELFENFDVHVAYKYYQVRTTINGDLQDLPFVPKDRFFINLAYQTRFERWSFDFTTQWIGRQRLPDTDSKPDAFRQPQHSPSYLLLNAQITHKLKKTFTIYVGGENLGNYQQQNAIIDNQNPFGDNFDAGIIYAPVLGRVVYTGLRWSL